MATGTIGSQARLFPWQMIHYIQRGGNNDPSGPPVTNTGTPNFTPNGGGVFSANSAVTLPQPPGSGNAPPRTQILNSTAGSTQNTTQIGSVGTPNNGGIYIGTIPQGAWIAMCAIQIFTAFATTGNMDTLAIAYAAAGTTGTAATNWAPPILNAIVNSTTMTAGYFATQATVSGISAFSTIFAPNFGLLPAQLGDIDLYVVLYKAAGTGTAFTTGSAAVKVGFSGLGG
jgi:hypothetical protein